MSQSVAVDVEGPLAGDVGSHLSRQAMRSEGILHLFPFTLLSAFAVARLRSVARRRLTGEPVKIGSDGHRSAAGLIDRVQISLRPRTRGVVAIVADLSVLADASLPVLAAGFAGVALVRDRCDQAPEGPDASNLPRTFLPLVILL